MTNPKIIDINPTNPAHCSLLEVALGIAAKRLHRNDATMTYFSLLEEAEKSTRCSACGAYGAEDVCESCASPICHRCADYTTYEDATICRDADKCEERQIRALASPQEKK